MSNVTDIFWEEAWDKYGADYVLNSLNPSLSGFQVYLEDLGLVPELQDE